MIVSTQRSLQHPAVLQLPTTHVPLFGQPLPLPPLRVSVVVPVRNEAHHLRQTLDALRQQDDPNGQPLHPALFEVLLLANNCTDDSFAMATQYQREFPRFALRVAQVQLPPERANIGVVRRLLMDEACRRLSMVSHAGIIASTDGDTVVDSHWIWHIIREIDRGADAVGGRILTREADQPASQSAGQQSLRQYHLRDVMYRTLVARLEARLDPCAHDPWPRHFQHFGANLAVTSTMYQQAGRLPEVPYLEDEAFYRALLRTDARIRKSLAVRVFTSTRTVGRVEVGFSWQLKQWADMTRVNQVPSVVSLPALVSRFRSRRHLRQCWQQANRRNQHIALSTLAAELYLDADWLVQQVQTSRYFGQLWEQVEQRMTISPWATQFPPVPVTDAIRDLRLYLAEK